MNASAVRPAMQASRTLLSRATPTGANRTLHELLQRQQHNRFFTQTTPRTLLRTRQQPSSAVSSLYRSLRLRLRRPYSTPPKANATTPNPTPHLGSPEPTGLSARLKKLSREYGWTAVGVYLALSALDFPFCFMAVRLLGTDRIGRAEHAVVSAFWRAAEAVLPPSWIEAVSRAEKKVEEGAVVVAAEAREGGAGWGVEEATKANSLDNASLGTQLALAYAIHKSFIFIRVPLTAAILPRVVKTLRSWGWNIGKKATP